MEKNYKLNNLAKLHAIQNMMEGHSEIEGQKLPNFLIDFFKDIEKDLQALKIVKMYLIDVGAFYNDFVKNDGYYDYEYYKRNFMYYQDDAEYDDIDEEFMPLSEDEFITLKEWLENE